MLRLATSLLVLFVIGTRCTADDNPVAAAPKRTHTNRLARETSPYLLMHAHNPVDWYPWSPEVFEKAKREGKPIFLSIGYSSCHWCHVMERLVFENEDIARTMNENFVNVKVDREERPDVDDVYMTAFLVYAQAIKSGEGGGWPLSMFLTPDGKPFAGGTFFPAHDVEGREGFPKILARVSDLWRNKRALVEKNADILASEVRRMMRPGLNLSPTKLERALATAAVKALVESVDPEFGGVDFNSREPDAAKFPTPPKLALLEYAAKQPGDEQAAVALSLTLDHIAAGGIRDHLGGGFHRYSTDRRWHVPHFEKMLYDQAQLAELYAEAYRRTGQRAYRNVAEETFDFVLNEMTDAEGGFISAIDAETGGVEGTYYLWSAAQIDSVLGPRDGKLFKRVYGLNQPQQSERGSVLYQAVGLDVIAKELRLPPDKLDARMDVLRRKVLAKRQERTPVPRDDKVLAAWNGLMIRALARGGAILKRDNYIQSAEKAATFVLKRMRNEQGELLRTYRADQAKIPAYLEDYAYVTQGLLALFETTRDQKWLRAARTLCDDQVRLFWDEESKGFFFTSQQHEALIARTRNAFDAVLPSGNSVSVRNLVRLASYSADQRYRELARQTLEAFAPALAQAPASMPALAVALLEYLDHSAPGTGQNAPQPATASDESEILQTAGQNVEPPGVGRVKAKAFLSVKKLPPGGQCEIVVFLSIKEGWHINSHSVQEWQIPTELTVSSKLGTKLVRVAYPKGTLARVSGSEQPVLVYEKEAAIRGVLAVPREAAGQIEEFRIQVRYQACNDRECDQPKSVKLLGKVPLAREGEAVQAANSNLFPKSR
jgi:uncharacterized protein YyaL (SSP411 family)